jgi:hypothetical protein
MQHGGKSMNGMVETAGTRWNVWRVARWSVAALMLLTPVVMMQVEGSGWNWGVGDFVFAAVMIGGTGLLYELAERVSGNRAYRAGMALALITSFLTVWTTIVRDDDTGIGYFLLIMAAAVGGFACRFRSDGMARAMLGIAAMQMLYGVAIATAPSTADSPVRVLLFNGFFAFLWLAAGGLFRKAAGDPAS